MLKCTLIYYYRLSTGNTTQENMKFYEIIFQVRNSNNYYGFNEITVNKSEKFREAFRQKDFDFEASLANCKRYPVSTKQEGNFLL